MEGCRLVHLPQIAQKNSMSEAFDRLGTGFSRSRPPRRPARRRGCRSSTIPPSSGHKKDRCPRPPRESWSPNPDTAWRVRTRADWAREDRDLQAAKPRFGLGERADVGLARRWILRTRRRRRGERGPRRGRKLVVNVAGQRRAAATGSAVRAIDAAMRRPLNSGLLRMVHGAHVRDRWRERGKRGQPLGRQPPIDGRADRIIVHVRHRPSGSVIGVSRRRPEKKLGLRRIAGCPSRRS